MNKIQLSERDLRHIVAESVRMALNEAENGGWTIETYEAEKAYEYFAQEVGNEEANSAIVRALGDSALADVLAYLFRIYDLKGWYEYKDAD